MATSEPILESIQETLISLLWASLAPSVGHEHRQQLQQGFFNCAVHSYKENMPVRIQSKLINTHLHLCTKPKITLKKRGGCPANLTLEALRIAWNAPEEVFTTIWWFFLYRHHHRTDGEKEAVVAKARRCSTGRRGGRRLVGSTGRNMTGQGGGVLWGFVSSGFPSGKKKPSPFTRLQISHPY